ncbi:hypothetical protein GCM10010307_36720 [Streptomyces vastus]|uniref:Transposase n=1 Tax=Streptomyces vastus TaxID=285451 RepID=A0ABP6DE06_9ACTN
MNASETALSKHEPTRPIDCHTPHRRHASPDRFEVYTSFKLAEHLDVDGIAASIGSVGDAYDNALMESKTGCTKPS